MADQDRSQDASDRKQIKNTLQIAVYSLPLLAVLAYFSGWWYRNQYFSVFGVNRSASQAPDYTIFIHAFSVIAQIPSVIADQRYLDDLIIPIFVLLLFGLLFPQLSNGIIQIIREQFHSTSRVVLSLVYWITLGTMVVFVIFLLSSAVGSKEARDILESDSGRRVELIFGDDAYNLRDNHHFLRLNESAKVVLIWRDDDETIVIDFKDDYTPLDVYRIDNDYVVGIVYDVRDR